MGWIVGNPNKNKKYFWRKKAPFSLPLLAGLSYLPDVTQVWIPNLEIVNRPTLLTIGFNVQNLSNAGFARRQDTRIK